MILFKRFFFCKFCFITTDKENCTNGKIWFDCKNKSINCPETCMDIKLPNSCVENEDCKPGCHCPEGLVEYNGQCIEPSQCPCYDSNGQVRLPGFKVPTGNLCQSWWVHLVCILS